MNKPKKIVHIGDIHIFLNKRHQEHRYVISLLVDYIKNNNVDLVYIGGDVIDSKNKLQPEQVRVATLLFEAISAVAPIVCIPGNHDCLVNNNSVIDSITPIVEPIQGLHPIYYLKDTGVYKLYDIDWCVWSCIDNKDPFEEVKEDYKVGYKIGCFHGAVNGAKTDSGFTLTSKTEISQFDSCDTVFLADIHKRYYFRNKDIAYCGGLIEAKVDEEGEKGGIVWTWSEKKQKYIPQGFNLLNIYGFKTYKINELASFDLDTVIKDTTLLSKTVRLLYTGEQVSFSLSKFISIKKELASAISNTIIIETVYKRNKKKTKSDLQKDKALRLKDLEPKKFLKLFLQGEELEDTYHPLIEDLDSLYEKQIPVGELATGEFFIDSIEIKNFLCFKGSNIVNLSELEGIIGLFGKNGSGKSSFFSSLMFCLFNKCPKDVPVYKLINDQVVEDKPECYVELFLLVKGVRYRIRRTIEGNLKKQTGKVSLEVYEITSEGVEIPKHDESRPKTDTNVLRPMIGDEATFLRTVYWEQKNSTEFVDAPNREKLDLFIRFLGVNKYDQKLELVTKDISEKEIELKDNKTLFSKLPLESELLKLLSEKELEYKNIKVDLKEKKNELSELESKSTKQKAQLEKYNTVTIITKELNVIEKEIEDNSKNIEEKKKLLQLTIEKNSELIKQWNNTPGLKGMLDLWSVDVKKSTEYEKKITEYETLIKMTKTTEEATHCITCGQLIVGQEHDIELHKQQQRELREDYQLKLQEVKDSLKELQEEEKKILEKQKAIKTNDSQIKKIKDEVESLKVKLQSCVLEKEVYQTNKEKSDIRTKLASELEDTLTRLNALKVNIGKLETTNAYNEKEIKKINKEIKERSSLEKLILEIENNIKWLSIYKKAVHRTGIPSLILESYIPILNAQINDYLMELFDFKVEFELSEGSIDIYFHYETLNKKGKRFVVQACGMEGIIINLAIRAALTKISLLPKPSLLMLDEVFAQLDTENIPKMKTLLQTLKFQYFNVLIISHIESMFDLPEHFIQLEHKKGETIILS